MPTRTISLSEDAYQALLSAKHSGESFSDVVRRLTRRASLTELAGIIDKEAADAIADAIQANRIARLKARRERLGLT